MNYERCCEIKRPTMTNPMRALRSRLTMRRLDCAFIDMVSGQEVFNYEDCYGDRWLAHWNRFGFRMKKQGVGDEN